VAACAILEGVAKREGIIALPEQTRAAWILYDVRLKLPRACCTILPGNAVLHSSHEMPKSYGPSRSRIAATSLASDFAGSRLDRALAMESRNER